jgi:hypothetical protein
MTSNTESHLEKYEIILDLASGKSKQEVCNRYCISDIQLDGIIAEVEKSSKDWYENLVSKHLIQLYMVTLQKIQKNIQDMENIAYSFSDKKQRFSLLRHIMKSRIDFLNIVEDGPSVLRVKQLSDEIDKDEEMY